MLRAGVDLGGTKIQVAIVDQDDQVLGTDRRPTPTTGTPDGVTDAIDSSVKAAITAAGV
ncbi:MAG: ROK family protein, partial [Actinobacteria bacterium]|nr:ROK family protein [Actinomycetota bacterium]